ncbi:hypothetical protein F9K33_11060 [bacterium]|nr:MAG: hypothetical protein F9K33_11060 [bacterium]
MNQHSHTSYLGKTTTLTGTSAIDIVESAICEGVTEIPTGIVRNIFGRPLILQQHTQGAAFAMGLSASGMRANTVMQGRNILREEESISESVHRHLAYVIQHYTENSNPGGHSQNTDHRHFHAVTGSGCIQFFAPNVQEAVDLTILGHKLAELSLCPVMVAMDNAKSSVEQVTLPDQNILKEFLGQGDDFIESPTPAQKMIFGKSRRRIPNWFHFDFPTIQGMDKTGQAQAFELAAQQAYFGSHAAPIADQLFNEFAKLTGRDYSPIASYKTDDADYVIIIQGSAYQRIASVVDHLRSKKIKAGAMHLRMVRPFPVKVVCEMLTGKKGVAILERVIQPLDSEPPIYRDIVSALDKASQNSGKKKNPVFPDFPAMSDREKPVLYSGQYGTGEASLNYADMIRVFENMIGGGQRRFFVDIDFTRTSSQYPKQQILLQNINRDYPEALSLSLTPDLTKTKDSSVSNTKKTEPSELPLSLRQYEDHGPPYSRVSQFYDRTGVFYETDATQEIVADPFQSIPVVPSSTATFIRNEITREIVPEFIPSKCTGCGQCSVYCPESAIPPIVISAESFIKSAVDQVQVSGTAMSSWAPPVIKNFAKMINQALSSPKENRTTFGGILPDILIKLAGQMKMEGERLHTLKEQFNAMTPLLNFFPVAVTKTFFSDCERQQKGSGYLFSVAINPQSCTGCGICADVCPEEALVLRAQDSERSAQLQKHFRLWEQLPDTPADVIQKMVQDKAYDPFAAILLSRNYYMSMAGGFNYGKSSSEKTMTHLVTAVTESLTQSRMNTVIKEIEQRIQSLSEKIQNKLREALPTSNFDAVITSFKGTENARVSLDVILKKLSESQRFGIVETAWMERIVTLINDLKTLGWALSKGPTGVGRARFGAVLSGTGSMAWAKQFPYNAFTSPVVIYDQPDSMNFIHGLCHGHIRQMMDNVKLLRRADQEMQNEYDPIVHDERIAALAWGELTENEKVFVPPVFVIADYKMIADINASSLVALLSSDFPIKILMFDSACGTAEYWRGRMAITTTVLSARNTFFLQSSMAKKEHLFNGLMDGMRHMTPSFFHILTPGFDYSEKSFQLALQSRAFPLLRFVPSAKKSTFAQALNMSANPDPYEDNISLQYEQEESAGSQPAKYVLTFADWAFHQPELKDQFTLMDDQNRRGMPVSEYVVLEPEARADKIPFIVSVNEQNNIEKHQVSQKIVRAVEAADISWSTLREMAGMLTPYPQKLKDRMDEEWSVKHTAALEQLKADYEEKLQQLENVQLEKIKQKLSDKLMALSGYGNK